MKKIILAISLLTIFALPAFSQVRTDGNPAVGVVSGDLQFVNNFDFFTLDVNGKGTLTIKTDPAYVGNIGVFAKVTPGDSVSYTTLNGYRQFDFQAYGSISSFGTFIFNVSGYYTVRVQATSLPGPQTLHYTIIPEAPNKDGAVNILGVTTTGTALNVNATGRVDITMDNDIPSMGPGLALFNTQRVVLPTDQSAIPINCLSGCGSPPATPDTAAFTAGSTNVSISAGVYDDTLAALSAGISGAFRLTPNRAIHVNLRDNSGTELTSLTVKQPTGTNLHIVCDSGCGSPTAFADNSAFTFATTGITNIGAVVDDTASTTVTEDNSGTPRMSSKRVLYGNLRNSAGTEVVTTTTTPGATDLALVTRLVGSPTVTANANVATWNGSTVSTGTGSSTIGTLRVVTASGSPVTATPASSTTSIAISANGTQTLIFSAASSMMVLAFTGSSTAGTITFLESVDSTNYSTTKCFNENGTSTSSYLSSVDVTTATGLYYCPVSGITALNLSATGWGVGTVTVKISLASSNSIQPTQVVTLHPSITQNVVATGTVTANGGSNLNTSLLALDSTQTNRTAKAQITDGTRDGTVKAGSTLSAASDTALVVTSRDTVTVSGSVTATQATGTNLHVVCDSGCSSAAAIADNAAFTFGTTAAPPVGFVVDDVATNSVTENSTGAARMSPTRIQYMDLSKTGSNATAVNVSVTNSAVPTNVTQLGSTNISVNSGSTDAGTQRVILATDNPSIGVLGTMNLTQVNTLAVSTAASGVQKVGIVGNAGAAFDAANNAAAPANVLVQGVEVIAQGSQPTAATAANVRRQLASTEGVIYVQEGNSNRFSCFVASTATVTTQCQAAPGAGLRAYITSVTLTNAVATAQSMDIVFGTGSACVTGTTAITNKFFFVGGTQSGSLNASVSFTTPLVPTAANAICVRPTAATAFGATITGFIAP